MDQGPSRAERLAQDADNNARNNARRRALAQSPTSVTDTDLTRLGLTALEPALEKEENAQEEEEKEEKAQEKEEEKAQEKEEEKAQEEEEKAQKEACAAPTRCVKHKRADRGVSEGVSEGVSSRSKQRKMGNYKRFLSGAMRPKLARPTSAAETLKELLRGKCDFPKMVDKL